MKREALSHPLAIAGVVLTTASAAVFIALTIAMAAGLLENPYAGLVVFIAVPLLFVLGLLLIPIGVRLRRRRLALHPEESADWPVIDFRQARVRRTTLVITALTAVNVVIVLLAGYGSLHWMESPSFCGQVCHTPMHPQFTAWQNGPHARVACVSCHIGEGAAGFVHAKLNGVRQLVDVIGTSYPRPIEPGAHMPDGAQALTCGRCHQPGYVSGDRLRVIREYADDEANTETTTILQMHVGAGSASGRAIHWHANPSIKVEYVATDEARQTIPYVRVTDANGRIKEYLSPEANDKVVSSGVHRTMDCVECHNTVGHPIAQTPERAVDDAMAAGLLSRKLPNARGEAVKVLTASHGSEDAAMAAIERGLKSSFESRRGGDSAAIGQTVSAVQAIYRGNVFPSMKVTWGSYPTNKGHVTSNGCFRCHDDSHAAKDGSKISGDCEYCHKQIEQPAS